MQRQLKYKELRGFQEKIEVHLETEQVFLHCHLIFIKFVKLCIFYFTVWKCDFFSSGTPMIRVLGHLTLSQRSLKLSSFLLILFFFFPLNFIYFYHSIFYLTYPIFCLCYSTVSSLQSIFDLICCTIPYIFIDSFLFLLDPC